MWVGPALAYPFQCELAMPQSEWNLWALCLVYLP
jgi:hypothetical protein